MSTWCEAAEARRGWCVRRGRRNHLRDDEAGLAVAVARHPPVHQDGALAEPVEAHVLRLDVAVQEAAAVGVAEGGEDVAEEELGRGLVEHAVRLQAMQ